jgi:magnesium-transporting ATPase (P-type)
LATNCTYNNNSKIDVKGNDFKKIGEPTEAALKVFAEKLCGSAIDPLNAFNFEKQIESKLSTVATLDFTSERKAMSTIVSGYKSNVDMLIKGAPDRIIKKCSQFYSYTGT